MNKEKQIEEMAKTVCHLDRTCDECMTSFECKAMMYAKRFYNAGYCKASELIEEIEKYILEGATTIESNNSDSMYGAKFAIEKVVLPILEAFKKKYTEEGK